MKENTLNHRTRNKNLRKKKEFEFHENLKFEHKMALSLLLFLWLNNEKIDFSSHLLVFWVKFEQGSCLHKKSLF